MTLKNITLASIVGLVTIAGTIGGGYLTVKDRIDKQEQSAVQRALQHEVHDQEIDRRLDNLELVVRTVAMEQSKKNQAIINQILMMKSQVRTVAAVQSQGYQPAYEYEKAMKKSRVSADEPKVEKPQ